MPSDTNTLSAGQALTPDQKLRSNNGKFELLYQTDGNLVIYEVGRARWHTRTHGTPAGQAVMQTDGNFVVYGPGQVAHWSTGTTGHRSADGEGDEGAGGQAPAGRGRRRRSGRRGA